MDQSGKLAIAALLGVCFSAGLMLAQYISLKSKSGKQESSGAAESIADWRAVGIDVSRKFAARLD